jgi:hypothetical protein
MYIYSQRFNGLGAIPTVPEKWSNSFGYDPLYKQIRDALINYETLAAANPDAAKAVKATFDKIVSDFQKELAVRPNRDWWEGYDRNQDEKRLNFMLQRIDRLRQDLESRAQAGPPKPPVADDTQADESGLSEILEKNDPFYPKGLQSQKDLQRPTGIPWWGYVLGVSVIGGLVWWRYSVIKRR